MSKVTFFDQDISQDSIIKVHLSMNLTNNLEGQGHISSLIVDHVGVQNQLLMISSLQNIIIYVHLHYDLDL